MWALVENYHTGCEIKMQIKHGKIKDSNNKGEARRVPYGIPSRAKPSKARF